MEAFWQENQHLKIQYEEIKSGTGNFDKSNVIGEGGFGMVYKGVLSHSEGHGTVAVKRLDHSLGQGDPEFLKEIVMLSRYKHENLIGLLGFCNEAKEKIIVYEHAVHGSLDKHLGSATLTWMQRLKICLAAAKGLCHLHDPKETQERVIHRDIKSSNILLDEDWNAKVSDFGLSKIGPANQKFSFLPTNPAGTLAYIDPMYLKNNILTKESDVYSFGIVLYEVLFGRLCYMIIDKELEILVPTWRQSYEEKKLDEFIFHELKQHIDLHSLETFSDVAYRCLKESREERPDMFQVVKELEIALELQEKSGNIEPPTDYEEMSKTVVPPLVYRSQDELKMLLSKGILIDNGKRWFWLNKNGEHCEMISAEECLTPIRTLRYPECGRNKSRFLMDNRKSFFDQFKIHARAQFLSPRITYRVNLVFEYSLQFKDLKRIEYTLDGEKKSSTVYFLDTREDGWLMVELYHFTSTGRNVDLEITFDSEVCMAVEGIEFQPRERVEEEDEEGMFMQTLSDADWEQKLPSDYNEIIQLSDPYLSWTTNKELYSSFRQGFLINRGGEWFSLAKNGKKCQMLSARLFLEAGQWEWRFLPESRFEQVASDSRYKCSISCSAGMLSPETRYGAYLVYKIIKNHSRFQSRVLVSSTKSIDYRHVYLHEPQIPIIRPKANQNTNNPLYRPKMKCFPQQRKDGWMEVQLKELPTNTTGSLWLDLDISVGLYESFEGLIVEGIEFKPM